MKRKTDTRLALVPQPAPRAGRARVKRYRIARVAAVRPPLQPVRA